MIEKGPGSYARGTFCIYNVIISMERGEGIKQIFLTWKSKEIEGIQRNNRGVVRSTNVGF